MTKANSSTSVHIPVLLEHVLRYLCPESGESYLDLTAGYGGHAREVLARAQPKSEAAVEGAAKSTEVESTPTSVLVDRDSNAITVLKQEFENSAKVLSVGSTDMQPVEIVHKDFYGASVDLQAEGRQFDMILADLGMSSPHLDVAERGFAIMAEGPLDMRMDQTQMLTAADIINHYSVDDLAEILQRYGEEPKHRQIARLIVQARKPSPIMTTTQLAAVVSKAWSGSRGGRSKVHPATRTFQALRIAVNDELRQLQSAVPLWMDLLRPGGRLVVISFHSLEDRIVKQAFANAAAPATFATRSANHAYDRSRYDTDLTLLTKRPVTAEPNELVFNPRSRSAKLRAVLKQK